MQNIKNSSEILSLMSCKIPLNCAEIAFFNYIKQSNVVSGHSHYKSQAVQEVLC